MLRNKLFLALSRAEISSLSNFSKICLYFLVCGTSFYGNRLSWEVMEKTPSEKALVFTFQKNMK